MNVVMVDMDGKTHRPERCPFNCWQGDEICGLNGSTLCAYVHNTFMDVPPPINCPLNRGEKNIIVRLADV